MDADRRRDVGLFRYALVRELEAMRNTLQHLVHCCHGDERPDCPILDELAAEPGTLPVQAARH